MSTTVQQPTIQPRSPSRAGRRAPAAGRVSAFGRPPHLRLVTSPVAGSVPIGPLRLTRRGRAALRLLVIVSMLVIMVGGGVGWARGARADAGPVAPVSVAHHVVLPGETLWSIALALAPQADPRETVTHLIEVNALPASAVHVGQRLALPVGLSDR